MDEPRDSRDLTSIVTTTCAAVFNLLVMLVICFWVGPRSEQSAREAAVTRHRIEHNQSILETIRGELETTYTLSRRMTKLLDEAEKKARKAKQKE